MVGVRHLICHCLAQYVVLGKIFNRLSAFVNASHRGVDKSPEPTENNTARFPKILLFRNAVCVIVRHCINTSPGYLDIIGAKSRNEIKGVRTFAKHYQAAVGQLTGVIHNSDTFTEVFVVYAIQMRHQSPMTHFTSEVGQSIPGEHINAGVRNGFLRLDAK